ncbi:hypothetical protein AOCH_007589 [Aspergillus ochraceoroseus]|uniref:Uncharacterized protein n=1 Tax=Aspergillus ochraceoroseus TaxID=138278 RepID=A0A0F8UCI6_9EURO|nr:hypothetical protein AOCH_007589 [Aspergillus ochraceoroseus]
MPASLPVLPESMETLLHNAPNKLRQYITKMYQFSTAAVEELHELSTLCSTITNLLNCIQQKDGVINMPSQSPSPSKRDANVTAPPTTATALTTSIPTTQTSKRLPDPNKFNSQQNIARVLVAACAAYARRGYWMFAATVADIKAALNPVTVTESELREQLPPEFTKFYDMFSPKEAERLPPHQPNNYEIKLLPGKTPPFGSLYSISRDKLKVLKE